MGDAPKPPGDILKITKSDQNKTIDELFAHSQPTSSYYTLLLLSSLIVSAGLLLGNSAIVIGGMLVTPVLTPILVAALGLAVGRLEAVRSVIGLLARSFLIVIAIGVLMAIIFNFDEPRGTIFDNTVRAAILYFLVAIMAGVAGTFAWVKKEISEVLPGTAIAVSLVPPLSLFGIWLASANGEFARYYLLVFLVNLFGIVMGSLIVFSMLRFYRVEEKVQKVAEAVVAEHEKAAAAKASEEAGRGK
jgi:uncharacterized hydrophobic protein (TIGR00271 family)